MKRQRTTSLLVVLGIGMILSSCSSRQDTRTSHTPLEISEAITQAAEVSLDMDTLAYGDEEFSAYVLNYYGLEAEIVDDGAIVYESGAGASEIAVLELNSETEMDAVEEAFIQYIEKRTASYYGYMPDQVYLLEHAEVVINGNYAALLICEESQMAETAFLASFGEQPEQETASGDVERSFANVASAFPIAMGEPDLVYTTAVPVAAISLEYDAVAILNAYRTGDASLLSAKNRKILDAASNAINEVITDGMTDYEKELAIHDWIIEWANYDAAVNSRSPNARPNPENDNPYGLLIDREAICSGYSSTFQLFMDMLNIECLTIEGAAYQDDNEHAWNMVRLDGEWYCVDLTWNDPTFESGMESWRYHRFFNVTSEYMLESEHIWDEASVPVATATTYDWAHTFTLRSDWSNIA